MAELYVANVDELGKAIDSTGVSLSALAVAGKLSRDTLNKARQGKAVSKTKANGIINGLRANGCSSDISLTDLFKVIVG